MNYVDIFLNAYKGYAHYLWNEITHPSWHNYFYWLIGGSLLFFILENVIPWRKNQPRFRKDFWLDAFYMFFNFFLFSLIIYNAASEVVVQFFNYHVKEIFNIDLSQINPMKDFPYWAILLIGFIVRDFVQWWIHRLLHRIDFLWNFHKVHHSVEEMGFAAQLRYHWMENIVYRSLEYIPLALLGINLYDFFIIHILAFTWGHFNHANITVDQRVSAGILGLFIGIIIANGYLDVSLFDHPTLIQKLLIILATVVLFIVIFGKWMRVLFNSPEMHIWHHAYALPKERHYGVNFGLTLGLWDYIFGTAYVPSDGRDIRLGFENIENFPSDFIHQQEYGILIK